MRFSRKSPAVGSTERHWPEADLSDAAEKARVAVSSRGLASAAAEGLRTLPALETAMTEGDIEDEAAAEDTIAGCVVVADCVVIPTTVEIGIGEVVTEGALVGVTAAPSPPPRENDWFGSAALQAAWSMTAPLTVKQVPAAFSGVRAKGPGLPMNGKS